MIGNYDVCVCPYVSVGVWIEEWMPGCMHVRMHVYMQEASLTL